MLNKVMLIGNVGKAPEEQKLPSGDTVVTFSIATSKSYTKDGQKEKITEWHAVKAYGKLADIILKLTKQGSMVYVEGSLKTSKWEKNGEKRSKTEIIADEFWILSKKDVPPEDNSSED